MTTTVYGIQLSPMARKVILALEAKQVPFTINPVTPVAKPEGFEKISPLGKIPALVDDQVTLADSTVICEYLEKRYPGQGVALYPEGVVEGARVRWLEEYADTAVLMAVGAVFYERMVRGKLLNQQPDEARISKALEVEIPKVFDYLESQLSDRGFVAGDVLTVADMGLGSHLINLTYAGEGVDGARWPKLVAYKDRLFATELFANRLASDQAMLAG